MPTGSGWFLLGILTLMQCRELPPLYAAAVPLIPLLVAWRGQLYKYCLWYACGFSWALIVCRAILSTGLPPSLEGVDLRVTGRVISLPDTRDRYTQFELRVHSLKAPGGEATPVPGKIRLSWYRPFPDIVPGSLMDLTVRLKRPHGYLNPSGFDYEAWLFGQRIRATGYVRRAHGTAAPPVQAGINTLRHYLRGKLETALPETPGGRLVPALTIGDRSRMDPAHWRVLTTTGTGHLLAISGLHIGLLAGFAWFLARWSWPALCRLGVMLPAQYPAAVAAMTAAVIYALLAGFTIPTRRALVMTGVVLLLSLIHRRAPASYIFTLALLAVLVFDPVSVLSPGFWLSFSAVLIILVVTATGPASGLRPAARWLRIQLAIFTGLIPVLVLWFNSVPLAGIAANLVAIPWVSFVSVPLSVAGTTLLPLSDMTGTILLNMGARSLDMLWRYLGFLAEHEWLSLPLPAPGPWTFLAAIAGTVLLLLPRGVPARWLGGIWLLPLVLPRPALPGPGEFELTVLDVGQGLAALVHTRNHALLYDTGSGTAAFNAGGAVIVPHLRSLGQGRLDMLILSHGDNDHAGGLVDVTRDIQIRRLISSDIAAAGAAAESCAEGQAWEWDGVRFEILHPPPAAPYRGNEASCVLKVGEGRRSVLLPGDIEKRAEARLVPAYGERLSAAVLVAPHHGSATSSTAGFVKAVSPELVLVSAGYLNRFRLPNQAIIRRYRDAGAAVLNTAGSGAISVRFDKGDMIVTRRRERARRFWHAEYETGDSP